MKTLLLTILAFVSIQLKAQTWVQVPDANFQTFLIANYPAGAFMNSGGSFFVDSEHPDIQGENGLDISSQNIASIEGIQAFGNLGGLDCHDNNLTSLPTLPNSLEYLECSYNQLSTLPALPNLILLYCKHNLLTSLPSLPNSLIYLTCSNNLLTTLPDPLPDSLSNLQCQFNQLIELPEIPATLIHLECNDNQLTQLPDLANLGYLYCFNNQLTSLPILPGSLYMLFCEFNQLSVMPDLPSVLQVLQCKSNQLTWLPELPATLQSFDCSLNQLTALPDLPDSLDILDCSDNQIACFGLFPEGLTYVFIQGNPFSCLPNYISSMGLSLLNYPLCDENDPVNNPGSCLGASGIEGLVFNDINDDCINTGQALMCIPISVHDSVGNLVVSSTSLVNGNYYFAAGSGDYELKVETANLTPAIHVNCPTNNSLNATVTAINPVVSGGDFGLDCAGFDLGVQSIVPTGWVFPGQTHDLTILAGDLTAQYNMHCASGISGEVTIAVTGPGVVTFGGSPTNVSANTAVYSIADFGVLNVNEFMATILTDTTAIGGNEFCVTVSVATAASGELDVTNNLYSYCYHVVNSYDPNVKETSPEVVQPGFIDEFTYTIHFQNTGTAPAFNIRLADTLDANLDLSTFKVVNASDAFTITLNPNTRLLTVRFPNIMLPASSVDPDGSIGFIQYRVKPVAGLVDGTIIENTAYIYFDFNSPIVTNTSGNLFSETAGFVELIDENIQLYPNPSDNQVFVRSENNPIEQLMLYDLNGTMVNAIYPNANNASIDVSNLKSGIYIVTIQTNQSVVTKRLTVR